MKVDNISTNLIQKMTIVRNNDQCACEFSAQIFLKPEHGLQVQMIGRLWGVLINIVERNAMEIVR